MTSSVAAAALLAWLSAAAARADGPATTTLRGAVHEQGTRRPVAGVEVSADGAEPALTDAGGAFVLDSVPAAVVRVHATALGFDPWRGIVDLTRSRPGLAIALRPSFGAVPAVDVVTRARREASQQTLGHAEIREVPGTAGDPLRAVTSLPGISQASDIDSSLFVRGSGPNDNAQYVDGIPAGYPYHFQGVASTFQAETIDRLTFYSGGFPAWFGDRTGGIFDLETRRAAEPRFTGSFGVSLITSAVTLAAPLPMEGLSIAAGARRGYFDFVLPRRVTDVAVPRYYDYIGSIRLAGSASGTWIVESFGAEDSAAAEVRNRTDPTVQGEFTWHHAFHVAALRWAGRVAGAEGNAVVAGSLSDTSVDLGQGYFFDQYPIEGYARAEARWGTGTFRPRIGAEGALTRHRMDAYFARFPTEGQGTYSFSLLSKIRTTQRITGWRAATYVSEGWEPSPGSGVEAGARLDLYGLTHTLAPAPRLSGRLALGSHARLLAAGGLYEQEPQSTELMREWGNPGLKPSRAWHAILGGEAEWGSWTASVEAYEKRLSRLVTPDPATVYSNAGTGDARGVEVLVRRAFTERAAGWLGGTYARSVRRDGPGTPERLSDYDIPFMATGVLRVLVLPGLTLGGRWRWSTGAPYTPIRGETTDPTGQTVPVFGAVNSARLPSYHRLDLRLEYAVRFDTWTLAPYVELLNAYDRKNLSTVVWSSNFAGERRIRQLPQTRFFGLDARF